MNEYKGRMPTKIELTLEQSQQGVSNDVLNIRVIRKYSSEDENPARAIIKQALGSMFKLRKLQIERGKPSLGSHGNSLNGTKNIPHAAITAKAFCPRWQQSSPLDSIFDSRKGIQSVAVMTEEFLCCQQGDVPIDKKKLHQLLTDMDGFSENDGFGPNKHPDGGILSAIIAAEAWFSGSDGSLGNPATYILSRSQNSFFSVCRESGNAHESHDELIELFVNSETGVLHLFSQNQLQEFLLFEREYCIWKMELLRESCIPWQPPYFPCALHILLRIEAVFQKDAKKGVFKNERERVNLMRNLNPCNVLIQNTFHGYEIKLCKLGSRQELEVEDPLIIETVPYKSEMRDLGETLLYIKTLDAYEFKDKGDEYYENLAISSF
nr:nuclear pore complex protein NUP107 isoform X2 [Tanacetum cinerariifolium]